MDTFGARQRFEKKASLTDNALDILDIYAPEKKSMFASLKARRWLMRISLQRSQDGKTRS